MLFFLSTPEYNKIQYNTTKVKVHLRNGIAEILEQHQDLIGRVENNLLEVESDSDNKLEKSIFVLQDAVFVVSNKPLETNPENPKGIGVYVYASRVREINSSTSIDDITKQYEQKTIQLDLEIEKAEKAENNNITDGSAKVILKPTQRLRSLKEEVEFLKKVIDVVKAFRA
jgi:hypothetical protein